MYTKEDLELAKECAYRVIQKELKRYTEKPVNELDMIRFEMWFKIYQYVFNMKTLN